MSDQNHPKAPHLLSTSANLLGFCFIVLTSVKISKLNQSTYIDEGAALAIVIFMTSCFLSFLSLRSKAHARSNKLEGAADVLFLCGLIVLFITTILIVLNII
ncbi:hypothetical protein [Pedobacter montanisoli]|uniref:DUF202 domain-containing protein n=1 Tax=Pedobacter montanisoli TaxID=2923277 RepID=A0ABS9ZW27_9SPHI|nr:hypothetical protein [Pedobacter montanisoli]MCJ0742513.1 hypothetical protein [Pedobacter montanisoli]